MKTTYLTLLAAVLGGSLSFAEVVPRSEMVRAMVHGVAPEPVCTGTEGEETFRVSPLLPS